MSITATLSAGLETFRTYRQPSGPAGPDQQVVVALAVQRSDDANVQAPIGGQHRRSVLGVDRRRWGVEDVMRERRPGGRIGHERLPIEWVGRIWPAPILPECSPLPGAASPDEKR